MKKEVLEKLVGIGQGLDKVKTSGDDSIIMVQCILQLRDVTNIIAAIVREVESNKTE